MYKNEKGEFVITDQDMFDDLLEYYLQEGESWEKTRYKRYRLEKGLLLLKAFYPEGTENIKAVEERLTLLDKEG
jgi:hypothetical protein